MKKLLKIVAILSIAVLFIGFEPHKSSAQIPVCPAGYVCVGNPYVTNQKVSVDDVNNGTQSVVKKTVKFSFTVANLLETDIYVYKDPNNLASTISTLGYTYDSIVASPGSVNGDTSSLYVIPAGGSRNFSINGIIDDNKAISGVVKIDKINYFKNALQTSSGSVDANLSTGFILFQDVTKVNPSITVQSGTLTLAYEGAEKDGRLIANFNLTVDGGSSGIKLYTQGGGITIFDQKDKYQNLNSEKFFLTPQFDITLKTETDNYGQPMYVIPANTKVRFTKTAYFNPNQMFAGTYYAKFYGLYANVSNNVENSYTLVAPTNSTNIVTVVGEKSPYISSISSPVAPGDSATVKGERLNYVNGKTNTKETIKLYIDNVDSGLGFFSAVSNDTLTFKVPGTIANGRHSFFIESSVIGKSNIVYFEVRGSTATTGSSATVTAGKLALTLDSNRNEALLSAPFTVVVTAGSRDLTFDKGSFEVNYIGKAIQYQTGTGIDSINGKAASLPFVLRAGQKATFNITGLSGPSIMFAGSYSFSLVGIYPTTNNGTTKELIPVPKNSTNSVVIVGEKSPYITSAEYSSQSGKLIISGLRLNDSTAFAFPKVSVDGKFVGGVDGTKDGTSVFLLIPLTKGQHRVFVENTRGVSNVVNFDVGTPTASPTPTTTGVPATPPVINSITGNKNTYYPGSEISLVLKGTEYTKTSASEEKGYNVQALIFPVSDTNFSNYLAPNPASSYNATYEKVSGNWNIRMNTPLAVGSYNMKVSLYCSTPQSSCWKVLDGRASDTVSIVAFKVISPGVSPSTTVAPVAPTPTPTVAPATVSLNSSASSIVSGSGVTLSWSTTGATSCTSNWGTVGTGGSVTLYPTYNITYTLSCPNSVGVTTKATASVSVSTPAASGSGTPAPTSTGTTATPSSPSGTNSASPSASADVYRASLWDAIKAVFGF